MRPAASRSTLPKLIAALLCVLAGSMLTSLALETALSDADIGASLMSRTLWRRIVNRLHELSGEGGGALELVDGRLVAQVSLAAVGVCVASLAVFCWIFGSGLAAVLGKRRLSAMLGEWGLYGWLWWLIPGAWEGLRLIAAEHRLEALNTFLLAVPEFWYALAIGGWLATFFMLSSRLPHNSVALQRDVGPGGFAATVLIMAALYAAVFTAMNWQLYRGLLVPHGDSAMYEEHLWNLTHGKGFRSYLDRGLFLGEHIQVIHLLLTPIYLLWPSHLLLELCESLALAAGALPVYWIVRRHCGSKRVATLLAGAYLLYFPLQFLDIAIDLKTFRPIAFGVPLVLFALDQLERGRYGTMIVLLLFALSAKEDYALVIAPLGVWIALRQARSRASLQKRTGGVAGMAASGDGPPTEAPARMASGRLGVLGLMLAVFGAVYLVIATQVVIPWFRAGAEVHYARYFSKFGETLGEIGWNMLSNPGLLFGELLTVNTVVYALGLLLPLGFVPLLAPGRLAVGLPLFCLLCLNEIAQDPRHHFHAPLVPIVFWASAAGLATPTMGLRRATSMSRTADLVAHAIKVRRWYWPAYFVFTTSLAAGIFFSLSPLGLRFWDRGSQYYWQSLYVPGPRAEMFQRVEQLIPKDSRVASTDFVHPRFTHYERSYDYSEYPRAVNDNKPGAPPDTDYIVIDTRHRYSKIRQPAQIPEYRNNFEDWELMPVETDGYFIVLRRRER